MADGGKRTPPGSLTRGCVHLKENFDVERDGRPGPFQPQPDSVRVCVWRSDQPNLSIEKEKTEMG